MTPQASRVPATDSVSNVGTSSAHRRAPAHA